MDALLRRRMMMMAGASPGPEPPTPTPEYITDGLVAHFDGINKGDESTKWKSLVGSHYYTLNANVTVEDNAIVTSGSGVITGTNRVSVGGKAGTIEVCGENLGGSGILLNGSASGQICFMIMAAGYTFCVNGGSNQWNTTTQSLFTCSANNNLCVVNGVTGGTKATNNWSSYSDTIGGRASGSNRYYSKVRIYSIRIYNRLLTEAEMINNQKVDNARFNLGLTI